MHAIPPLSLHTHSPLLQQPLKTKRQYVDAVLYWRRSVRFAVWHYYCYYLYTFTSGCSYLGARSERSVFIFVYYTELGMLNFFMYNMARALYEICVMILFGSGARTLSLVLFFLYNVQHIAG